MNPETYYTPEELAKLIAGETVTTSSKDKSVSRADKIKEKVDVADAQKPKTFKPANTIPINSRTPVDRPHIKDKTGKRVTPDEVVTPSREVFDRIDQDLLDARAQAKAQLQARQEIKRVADPANLLNRLNAQHRVITKMQKQLDKLTKEQS